MVDIDKLLMGEDLGGPKKRDRVDDLLEGVIPTQTSIGGKPGTYMLQTGQEPTGAIDTRTSQPIMRPVPTGEQQAGFVSLAESRQVDDPQTRIQILAKNRGISPDKYGVVNGRIVYQGADGKLYFEEPDTKTLGGLAKDVAATVAGHPEEIGMGIVGASGGPLTAGLLAAGGAGLRKVRGKLMYDEPQTEFGNIKEMGVAGGTAGVGSAIGGKLIGIHDRALGKEGSRLVKAAGRGRERISLPETQRLELAGQRFGVDLLPPQTTRSPELISRFNILGDLPETADLIGVARRKQNEQVVTAIDDFLGTISRPTSPGEAGRRGVEAARKAIEEPYEAAQKASKQFYDQAKLASGVDISQTIQKMDGLLDTAPKGSLEQKALQKIKGMLMREGTDPNGKPIMVPEDRVISLDKVKKEVNAMWKQKPYDAPTAEAQRAINSTLDDMLKEIDSQVPEYAMARKAYQQSIESSGVDALKKSRVGTISNIDPNSESVEKVSSLLFDPNKSSPDIVIKSKKVILKYGGQDAWDALVRVHLQGFFDKATKPSVTGGVKNVGGWFSQAVNDPRQMKILEAAFSDRPFVIQNIKDFSEVMNRSGLILGKESTTATRQYQLQGMKEEALPAGFRYAEEMVNRPWNPFVWVGGPQMVESARRAFFERSNERLANAMLSPRAATELQRMLRLKPESQALLRRITAFLTSVSGGEFEEIQGQSTRPDVLPTTLQQRLAIPQRHQGGRLEWLQ